MLPGLVRGDDVALIDFQFVGSGLGATDLAHFVTAAVAGESLLGADGALRDAELVDAYLRRRRRRRHDEPKDGRFGERERDVAQTSRSRVEMSAGQRISPNNANLSEIGGFKDTF